MENDKELVSIKYVNNQLEVSCDTDFTELFGITMKLVEILSNSTGGEISYNEILDDMKLIEENK